jgi:hypothetical protein
MRAALDTRQMYFLQIGETFRVLKEKEEKQYSEYRTRLRNAVKEPLEESGIEIKITES